MEPDRSRWARPQLKDRIATTCNNNKKSLHGLRSPVDCPPPIGAAKQPMFAPRSVRPAQRPAAGAGERASKLQAEAGPAAAPEETNLSGKAEQQRTTTAASPVSAAVTAPGAAAPKPGAAEKAATAVKKRRRVQHTRASHTHRIDLAAQACATGCCAAVAVGVLRV